MIDEEKQEEQLEEEEIVVELPSEESEGTEKPEEPKDTEAPVESEETVEEESESVDDEEEDEVEKSEEEDESKDKKVFGKRAEKRIKRLVKEKKELEAKVKELKQQEESWTSERAELKSRTQDSELHAINQYIDRLKAQEKQSLSALRTAKESGDIDAEIKAQDDLASVKAETLVAEQYKSRAETSPKKEVKKEQPKQEQTAAPDRQALNWQKRNEWFGGSSTKDRIMTQAAMVIHKELIEEGIGPNISSDEYYNELDMRIRDEFPEKFKNKSVKKIPTVMGGTRSTLGKNQIKLTKTEVEMANRLGVSLQEYARQKVRQTQAGG